MLDNLRDFLYEKYPQGCFHIRITGFKSRSIHLIIRRKRGRLSAFKKKQLFENLGVLSNLIHNFSSCEIRVYLRKNCFPFLRLLNEDSNYHYHYWIYKFMLRRTIIMKIPWKMTTFDFFICVSTLMNSLLFFLQKIE